MLKVSFNWNDDAFSGFSDVLKFETSAVAAPLATSPTAADVKRHRTDAFGSRDMNNSHFLPIPSPAQIGRVLSLSENPNHSMGEPSRGFKT